MMENISKGCIEPHANIFELDKETKDLLKEMIEHNKKIIDLLDDICSGIDELNGWKSV